MSNITNNSGVEIHVYVFRLVQWKVAIRSAGLGGGAAGIRAKLGFDGDIHTDPNAIRRIPEFKTFGAGKSQFLNVPRFRWFGRKAAFVLATKPTTRYGWRPT